MADLILKGGRVIDPASGRDETADVAFANRKIAEIGRDLPAGGIKIVDVRGKLVVPGLVDLHTHVYWGGTSLGVDAAEVARAAGTTTFIDGRRCLVAPAAREIVAADYFSARIASVSR
jgi:dihydroorotase